MNPMSRTFDLLQGEPRSRLVEELRRKMVRWEVSAETSVFSSGVSALDGLLPGGGLRYGMLTEWLSGLARCGAATLSLLCAREACRSGGVLVVIDRLQTFYPPAAAAWGIDLERLIIVRPRSVRDELWAAVQGLRSPAVAAVWAMVDRLDARAFRRLQLAAQAGRTLGLLLRPSYVRGQPSWADVRLEVGAGGWGLGTGGNWGNHSNRFIQIRVLRTRAGRAGGSVILEIDDAAYRVREAKEGYQHDAHPMPVVAELADPAPHPLSARA
jgi:hypothetical protein